MTSRGSRTFIEKIEATKAVQGFQASSDLLKFVQSVLDEKRGEFYSPFNDEKEVGGPHRFHAWSLSTEQKREEDRRIGERLAATRQCRTTRNASIDIKHCKNG